jgi:hypothetical protein
VWSWGLNEAHDDPGEVLLRLRRIVDDVDTRVRILVDELVNAGR